MNEPRRAPRGERAPDDSTNPERRAHALTRRPHDNPAHLRVLRRLVVLTDRIRRDEAKLTALHAERAALYLEGRALDPPVGFNRMADAAGVTGAAVIQVAKRAEAAAVNGDDA